MLAEDGAIAGLGVGLATATVEALAPATRAAAPVGGPPDGPPTRARSRAPGGGDHGHDQRRLAERPAVPQAWTGQRLTAAVDDDRSGAGDRSLRDERDLGAIGPGRLLVAGAGPMVAEAQPSLGVETDRDGVALGRTDMLARGFGVAPVARRRRAGRGRSPAARRRWSARYPATTSSRSSIAKRHRAARGTQEILATTYVPERLPSQYLRRWRA